jgi:hypothetical protein
MPGVAVGEVVVAMVVVVARSGEEEDLVRSRRLTDLSQNPLVRCCLAS